MLTESEYRELRARLDVEDEGRKQAANLYLTNEQISSVEVYEFAHSAPERYFAYVQFRAVQRLGTGEDRYGEVTTWTGDKLGGIAHIGHKFRSNMGDIRIPITVRAINGRTYFGTYYVSSGDYCRLKLMRERKPRSKSEVVKLAGFPVIDVSINSLGS